MYSSYHGCLGLPLWDISLNRLLSDPRDTQAKPHRLLALSLPLPSTPLSVSLTYIISYLLSHAYRSKQTLNLEFFPLSNKSCFGIVYHNITSCSARRNSSYAITYEKFWIVETPKCFFWLELFCSCKF